MTEGKLDSDDIITIIEAVRAYERSLKKAKIKGLSIDREIAEEFVKAEESKRIEMIMTFNEMVEFCAPLKTLRNCVSPIVFALREALQKQSDTPNGKVTIYRYDHECIEYCYYHNIYPSDTFGCDSKKVVRKGEEYVLKDIARGYGN